MENGVRTGGRESDGGAYSGQRNVACQARLGSLPPAIYTALVLQWVFRNTLVSPCFPTFIGKGSR